MKIISSAIAIILVTSGSAIAAGSPPAYPSHPPLWTGFYAGLNVGHGWDASPNVYTSGFGGGGIDAYWAGYWTGGSPTTGGASALSASGAASTNASGVIGGGQIGYNWQFHNNFVAGIEADFQGADIWGRGRLIGFGATHMLDINAIPTDYRDQVTTVVAHEKSVDWLGTLRGRLGWLATPSALFYVTGGLAYGGATVHTGIAQFWTSDFGPGYRSSGSAGIFDGTRVGWTVGGGLEWMFAANWSVKGEYLYYDLGALTYANSPLATVDNYWSVATNLTAMQSHTRLDGHIARAGLNYHFDSGVIAGVAGN